MPPGITTLAADAPTLSAANTGFMLICSALVMIMTPGLAFFYGGMVRVKSTLNMLMMSFISLGIVTILWVLYGFSLAFGTDIGSFIGWSSDFAGLSGIGITQLWDGYTIPVYVFAVFQLMFAIITPALISGALADRVKFTSWALFVALWVTVVYFPVAHWVWGAAWLALRARRHRLRRWYGRPHQRRCGSPRRDPRHRQAGRLQEGPDAAAQPAARHARRRSPVVRLVRLQQPARGSATTTASAR